jgi:hypothetical protein
MTERKGKQSGNEATAYVSARPRCIPRDTQFYQFGSDDTALHQCHLHLGPRTTKVDGDCHDEPPAAFPLPPSFPTSRLDTARQADVAGPS